MLNSTSKPVPTRSGAPLASSLPVAAVVNHIYNKDIQYDGHGHRRPVLGNTTGDSQQPRLGGHNDNKEVQLTGILTPATI